ncbi:MAG: hypothetical protein WBM61_05890, partial [Woeseiaceae bacterium]
MKAISITFSLMFVLASAAQAGGDSRHRYSDARLTIAAPESRYVRVRYRDHIKTLRYRNKVGALSTTQWPLILRFESRTAVGFAASATADGQKREALV